MVLCIKPKASLSIPHISIVRYQIFHLTVKKMTITCAEPCLGSRGADAGRSALLLRAESALNAAGPPPDAVCGLPPPAGPAAPPPPRTPPPDGAGGGLCWGCAGWSDGCAGAADWGRGGRRSGFGSASATPPVSRPCPAGGKAAGGGRSATRKPGTPAGGMAGENLDLGWASGFRV